MEKKIELYGHDSSKKWLEQIGNTNKYQLKGDCVEYTRTMYDKNEDGDEYCIAIDPPGGPFLNIGDVIGRGNYCINEFIFDKEYGLIIILEYVGMDDIERVA